MAAPYTVDFLRTKVTNSSGADRFFGFIWPHGKFMVDGESVEIQGNLMDRLRTQRAREAYENAVATGEITVEFTPAAIVTDDTLLVPKQVIVDNNVVLATDPRLPSL